MNKQMTVPGKLPKKTRKIERTKGGRERYVLQLFVAGILPNSIRAIENANSICKKYLTGRYELEIIDIYQQPKYALLEEIVALPLLIKRLPLPEERLVGDLSDVEKVLKGLHITD